jgi:NAD(P)-dependent dehydrogenase (short-subunit alcohol dehydrogenase family)
VSQSPSSSPESVDGLQPVDKQQLQATLAWLEELVADRERLAELSVAARDRLLRACGQLVRPDRLEKALYRKARRRKLRGDRRDADEAILDRTGIRVQRLELVYPTPELRGDGPHQPGLTDGESTAPAEQLGEACSCYICKADFREVHRFYDALCPACAAFNWSKREQAADLNGRVALLTGGRVKIGYQVGIKLLRAGARLIVTTRFPRDAAARYGAEPDFEAWGDRLVIFGLDLRHTPSVEALCAHLLRSEQRLDMIVNNACQTVRRPPGFYGHLMDGETKPYAELSEGARSTLGAYERLRAEGTLPALTGGKGGGTGGREVANAENGTQAELPGLTLSAALSQLVLVDGDEQQGEALFPEGRLDADLQQVDLRQVNSWRLPLAAVSTVELLEVTLVNAIAPFVLDARLKPLMLRTPGRDKHIVNVSAMEGQFYRAFKTDKHPHTNMAKAALNMLTRTSAPDYQRDGIHMNAVDTGWITDEDPHHITVKKRDEHGFHPPLDHVDAAARILDPVFTGLATGVHLWGQFLKDYKPAAW